MTSGTRDTGVAVRVRDAAEAVSQLVAGHLRLARLELRGEVNAAWSGATWLACFVALALVGYLFLALAVVALLQPLLGWTPALLVTGTLQLVAGGIGAFFNARRLGGIEMLDRTVRAAGQTVEGLSPGQGEPPKEQARAG